MNIFNFNITQIVYFIIRMLILNFFKKYLFVLINYLEKNNLCSINTKDLIFYGGIINEKLSNYLNNNLIA